MKHRQNKLPDVTTESDLPAYGIIKTIRLNTTEAGRTHLTAVSNEELRRYRERESRRASVPLIVESPIPSRAIVAKERARRSPSGPIANRTKIIINSAISGHRDSPFENVEAKRPFSRRAKRLALALGAVASVAAVSTVAVFGYSALQSHNKESRAQAAATSTELGKNIKSTMTGIDKQILAAMAQDPGNFRVTPAGAGAPAGAVEITDKSLGSQDQPTYAVMGTFGSGPKQGQPNAAAPIYFRTDILAPSYGKPMLGEDDGFVLSSSAGSNWASEHNTIGGPAGVPYATEFQSVNTTGNDPALWYTTYQLSTNQPAPGDGWGESGLDSGAPDTSVNRALQIETDLSDQGPQQF